MTTFRGRLLGRDTGLPRSADTTASAAAGAPAGGAAASSGGLAAPAGAAAPVLLIDPDTIYDDLITPSLFALWLSQLIPFAVYGLYITIQTSSL